MTALATSRNRKNSWRGPWPLMKENMVGISGFCWGWNHGTRGVYRVYTPQFFNIMAWGHGDEVLIIMLWQPPWWTWAVFMEGATEKKKNGRRFVDMLQVATKVVALISALDILRVILSQVTFTMYFYFHRIHRYHCMISILFDRLGEHETQRDILERALGIMEAEFGANSHKDGGLCGDDVRVCFLWILI